MSTINVDGRIYHCTVFEEMGRIYNRGHVSVHVWCPALGSDWMASATLYARLDQKITVYTAQIRVRSRPFSHTVMEVAFKLAENDLRERLRASQEIIEEVLI